MDLDIKKDILHKSCEIIISDLKKQIEEMYKDNKDMFKKYNFIESQLNKLIVEKEK